MESVVRSAKKRLCEGELCRLGNRRNASALYLLYEMYQRADYPMHEHIHHFGAAHNTRCFATLDELALVIPRCRID